MKQTNDRRATIVYQKETRPHLWITLISLCTLIFCLMYISTIPIEIRSRTYAVSEITSTAFIIAMATQVFLMGYGLIPETNKEEKTVEIINW